MKTKVLICFLTCLSAGKLNAQNDLLTDSSSFHLFRDKKVWYTDLGFSAAPFSLKFKDSTGHKEHLYYRNNMRTVMGAGFCYKWFSLRLSFALPGNIKPVSKFGKSSYFHLGFDFKIKRFFFDFDIQNYTGYSIRNAYRWDDSLDVKFKPNYLVPETNTLSVSLNSWSFLNKKIQMAALIGKTGRYLKEEKSFYLKSTINIYGVSNSGSLIPVEKQNPANSKTAGSTFSAFDFGVLPGYLYVNRYKDWQFSGMFGFGPVIQSKYYIVDSYSRSFLGIAPRIDIRVLFGYNVSKWFVNFVSEFDNKSIRFSDLNYRQTFYTIKLVGGIRLG